MKVSDALNDWTTLQEGLQTLDEQRLWSLLELEKIGAKRLHYIERIYGRANKLRVEREKKELGL